MKNKKLTELEPLPKELEDFLTNSYLNSLGMTKKGGGMGKKKRGNKPL